MESLNGTVQLLGHVDLDLCGRVPLALHQGLQRICGEGLGVHCGKSSREVVKTVREACRRCTM